MKTVFIIGAGASAEAKLPTGRILKDKIASLLDIKFTDMFKADLKSGDTTVVHAIRQYLQENYGNQKAFDDYIQAARHIHDALPQERSIDEFIDKQKENKRVALCGKLAIIKAILEAERGSPLSELENNSSNFSPFVNTWYNPFFRLLIDECRTFSDLRLRFESIVLIIFNYDRCIEYYLYHSLKNYYRFLSEAEVIELIKAIKIYHPYGMVGNLPWGGEKLKTKFGFDPNPKELLRLVPEIMTFTESIDRDRGRTDYKEMQMHMGKADKLVFLGFGFIPLNMKLLNSDGFPVNPLHKKCFATRYGISDSDKDIIMNDIKKIFVSNLDISFNFLSKEKKCSDLFNEYERSLWF